MSYESAYELAPVEEATVDIGAKNMHFHQHSGKWKLDDNSNLGELSL